MALVDFYLYRLKLFPPHQGSLFEERLSRPQAFRQVLQERPSAELRQGTYWHIGNLTFLDDIGGYFAIGRTTKSTHQTYDGHTKNFVEDVLESSPYTHVVFDSMIGFLAIAQKTRLAPTTYSVARNISNLFRGSELVQRSDVVVQIDPILDPSDFIESVRAAYSVRRFEVTFSRSNPFDADEFFQKPMEKYIEAANAEKGKSIVSGRDLDKETLVNVTKSVAASGNDAKAVMKYKEDSGYISKKLHSNPAHFSVPEQGFEKATALQESRRIYTRIRGMNDVYEDHLYSK